MPPIVKNIKRGFRRIIGHRQRQQDIPPTAVSSSITPGPSATSRQHAQEQPRDNVFAISPISPTVAPSSITPEEPSATSRQHVQEQSRDSSISTPPADHQQPDAAQSLWDRAYNALAKENPDLVKQYDEVLAKEQMAISVPNETTSSQISAPPDPDTSDRSSRQVVLNTVIQNGLQRMEDNKTTLNIAGHEIVLADQITKAAKFLLWGKDWIDTAVKASPEASLVWSGVCLILPLLTNPTTAAEANKDGFSYVTSRLRYYVALEPMLRQLGRNASVNEALVVEADSHLVDLYQAILDFQLSSVLRFYQSRFKIYVHDTVTSKDWNQTLCDIKAREQTLNSDFSQINNLAAGQELERLNKTSEDMKKVVEEYLSVSVRQLVVTSEQLVVSSEHLIVSSEHLIVSKEHLAAERDAQRERLLAKQEADRKELLAKQDGFLRELYLTRNDNGASYEWYKDRVERRVEGTCNWFLQQENFQKWLSQESGPLLVSADPGCGKSVLAKYLIDHVLAQQSATICYFFFKDQDQNTVRQALCALLHQLFSAKRVLLQHVMNLLGNKGTEKLIQSETSLWTILRDALRDPEAGPVIFVIDALDECDESQLSSLVGTLMAIFGDQQRAHAKFKVLMTSRPYEQVVSDVYRNWGGDLTRIHIPGEEEFETISQEINHVIHYRVEQLARSHRLSNNTKSSLVSKLLAIEHRTYLWVFLVFDYLNENGFKRTDAGINAAIQTLPETVNQAYDRILSRSQEGEAVNKALSIILAARRPLTISEMNVAMNVDSQCRGQLIDVLDLEADVDFKFYLRDLCGLFVNIHHDKVYFLHQTAREFLIQSSVPTTVSSGLQWHHSITTRHAHSVLAEICMLYLDMLNSTHTQKFHQDGQHGTLVEYSAEHWGDHCREAEFEKGSAMVDLTAGLCTPDLTSHSQWASIFLEQYNILPGSATNVLVASHLGLTAVTELLLSSGAVIEAKNGDGWTALMLAANSGHDAVARLLLGNRANVEAKDGKDRTALTLAARSGHEAVARLLLENRANVEAKDEFHRTALMLAANFGHEAVIRLLLENCANVEAKEFYGRTALTCAAINGHEAVTRLLLEKGASVDPKDDDGWTALMLAAESGHEAVTRLILEKGASVEARDNHGKTALMFAASDGHEAVTRLLIDSGADIEARDNHGKTALMLATESGHEAVIQLLHGKGADVEAKAVE